GGSGSTTALAISTNSFIGVSAGQSYDATITKTDIAIDQVTFATTSSVNSVEVRVESYGTNVPSGSAAVETTVGNGFAYQYLKIETTNLNSVLKDANVKFSVTKEWLSVNGISVNNVALYKYANSVWQKLPTLKTGESSTEVMYEATVTSFSTFVIAADKTSTAPPPTSQCGNGVCEADESQASCSADCKTSAPISRCGDGVCDADESVSSCPADCVTTPQTEQKDNAMSWAIVIVIVIILGLVYFVYTKYK
ncbi:MAG TPA: PGF-pre-PGF domain-containing protein, partial [archaeon]|nr:PGF-pre-PGF domain-containing protein [archaeon]